MAAKDGTAATAIGTVDDPTRGIPYHNAETLKLKKLLEQKRIIDSTVKSLEEQVHKREGEYLESTPNGNILMGFDNYIKGGAGTAGPGRRKAGFTDNDRIFSRSSIRLIDGVDSPASSVATPSHAPTPITAASHLRHDSSAAATPTSATSGKGGQKKGKKRPAGDDSETDTKESKKIRTAFGAGGRK